MKRPSKFLSGITCGRSSRRLFCGLTQATRELNEPTLLPGFNHLHIIRRENEETGTVVNIVGVKNTSNADSPQVAAEVRAVFQAIKPDVVVAQYCEQRYRATVTATGEEILPLASSSLLDTRHIMNSVRAALHLINRVTSGPRWNPYMYATQIAKTYEARVILGDIPFGALQYRNDLQRTSKEVSNYAKRAPKDREQLTYPEIQELVFGLESVEKVYLRVERDKHKINTKEKVVSKKAAELQKAKQIGRSFLEDTAKSMAHATYNADGQTVLCLCNYLTMDLINQYYGQTSASQVKSLRTAPPPSTQSLKIVGSWITTWWNGWCAMMYGLAYMKAGYVFEPETVAMWLVGIPMLYPAGWAAASFRGRWRVRKFQQIIASKRNSIPRAQAVDG